MRTSYLLRIKLVVFFFILLKTSIITAQECISNSHLTIEEFQRIKKLPNTKNSEEIVFGLNVFVESDIISGDYFSTGEIEAFLNNARSTFIPLDIDFEICNTTSISNLRALRILKSGSETGWPNYLKENYTIPNQINVFFGKRSNFLSDPAAGFYGEGRDDDFIIVFKKASNGNLTSISALTHEIGHYFGLNHTHGAEFGDDRITDELVTRNPSLSNCEIAGDGFCDTQADPGLDGRVDNNCNFSCDDPGKCLKDSNGSSYIPDTRNVMSYGYYCREHFSPEQAVFMNNYISQYRLNHVDCNGAGDFCLDYLYEPSDLDNPYENILGRKITSNISRKIIGNSKSINDSDAYEFEFNLQKQNGLLRFWLSPPFSTDDQLILWEKKSNGSLIPTDSYLSQGILILNTEFTNQTYVIEVIPKVGLVCNENYALNTFFIGTLENECQDDYEPNNSINEISSNSKIQFGPASNRVEISACIDKTDLDLFEINFPSRGFLSLTSFSSHEVTILNSDFIPIVTFDLRGKEDIEVLGASRVYLRIVALNLEESTNYNLSIEWTPSSIGGGEGGSYEFNCDDIDGYTTGEDDICFELGNSGQNLNYCNDNEDYPGYEHVYLFDHNNSFGGTSPEVISISLKTDSPYMEVFLLSTCDENACIPLKKWQYTSFDQLNNLPGAYQFNMVFESENPLPYGEYYIVIDEKIESENCYSFYPKSGFIFFIFSSSCDLQTIGLDLLSFECDLDGNKIYNFEVLYDSESINSFHPNVLNGTVFNKFGNRFSVLKTDHSPELLLNLDYDLDYDDCVIQFKISDFNCPCEEELPVPLLVNGFKYNLCPNDENPRIHLSLDDSNDFEINWFSESDLLAPLSNESVFIPNEGGTYYVAYKEANCYSQYVPFVIEYSDLTLDYMVSPATDPYSQDGAIELINSTQNIQELEFNWSNNLITSNVNNLGNGMYSLFVLDKLGCEYIETFDVPVLYADADGDLFNTSVDCDDNNPEINPNQNETTYNGIDDDCNPSTLDDDLDEDGFLLADDCDDENPNINPNQNEITYNGIDDDCNPSTLDNDLDEDGFLFDDDCDDENPNINPGQNEITYNGIDDDCNPSTLDDDLDEDGFLLDDDCDDENPNINPGQNEITYNGIDDDCNPSTLDDDLDEDGFLLADDCDDENPNINPGQNEITYNGIDDDCNPSTLDDDLDEDGFLLADDCDDENPNINPGQNEITYNGIDDDCNPSTLDDDLDEDGFLLADDCDDENPNINPGQNEITYNGIDDDCNPSTLDDDLDEDGFLLADDCDDENPNINPDQNEITYNGIDDDCNPSTLDDDLDEDGFLLADDCDDENPNINPGQNEITYNGIDDDCNPSTLDDDLDEDGFLLADDCDDENPNINPNSIEIPGNGIDEDCDGIDGASSIKDIKKSIISVKPNPVITTLYIETNTYLEYQLYTIQGAKILSGNQDGSSEIDIKDIAPDLYLLKFTDPETGKSIIEKIIKL